MGQILSVYGRLRNRKWDVLDEPEAAKENELMFQGFEWHVPADQQHWNRLRESLPRLKSMGVSNIWIPPGCKGATDGNGYDIYDLYDVGEFEQKGQTATKWGSRADLEAFISLANELDIGIYWDAVLNHKDGADTKEKCRAVEVDPKDRNVNIAEPREVEAWLGYDFPGRGTRYSEMKYHWYHFSGINYDTLQKKSGIFKLIGSGGKDWAKDVSTENGNYDYLIFADVDYSNAEVKNDVKHWIEWLGTQFKLKGLRLDAVKHYSRAFLKEFIQHIRTTVGKDWFLVAEFWTGDISILLNYFDQMEGLVSLFDAPLAERFSLFAKEGQDMRRIFDKSFVKIHPQKAVTFVSNHDTQPGQSLEILIDAWFKPLAYALILLRRDGYPCLFYGDLYGITNTEPKYRLPPIEKLAALATIRAMYAYGKQRDYFDHRKCIGFVRYGDTAHPSGMACVLNAGSSAAATSKTMYVGIRHAGEKWTEVFSSGAWTSTFCGRNCGCGREGRIGPKSVSVWVDEGAEGRGQVDVIAEQFV
ncbi:glucan 1,4-alpha-maltohexaosidase [Nannizzia gypsea CBS 118893]|uniref:Glucan 1,4-alpha-maltohexaosidase n=1 Tax=Arthroderma gypseum (strain ATCC MYA-4604 / CBS 118893) TaxID=535722 RepID=E4V1Y8_ARTGP|nr:glucan 1,4-alpha-maltohexaosidase [Nannizzia gypsea CBS 118893]EFR04053.1 glucan 1,4-alpha-maltohexaosidase [Nannizzia gypsea CBS 118893]